MNHWSRLSLCIVLSASSVLALAQKQPPLERGKYLMEGLVACGNCHMARGDQGHPLPEKGLSGGFLVIDAPVIKAYAPNITPDLETGIGKWTDAQLGKAIREGVRPGKSLIGPPMPIELYRNISDNDLAAIIAYLRAQPAVRNIVPKSEYKIPVPTTYGPPVLSVKAPDSGNKVAYGEYLANIGHCMHCHTPLDDKFMLQRDKLGVGGVAFPGPWGASVSRNLTPHETGLKNWTDAQIVDVLHKGVNREGQPYKPPMPFDYFKGISNADVSALIAYLRTIKPQVVDVN